METFPERLNRLLHEHRYNGRRLAAALGVVPQTVSKWLKGGGIEDEHVRQLAELFGMDWLELKYGEPVAGSGSSPGPLTAEQRGLLEAFDKLSQRNRKLVVDLARALGEGQPR